MEEKKVEKDSLDERIDEKSNLTNEEMHEPLENLEASEADLTEADQTDIESEVITSDISKKDAVLKEIFSWVKIIVGAIVVAFILSHFVIINARVPSGSMISTINIGDHLIGFRLSYTFSEPKRGDIVMFEAPDIKNKIYIKRIIGLPGDKILIKDCKLYINGKEQKEDYVKNGWSEVKGTYGNDVEYEVPKGEYFMMGDNRDKSSDSRVWGSVKRKAIIAKALFRYYPSFKSLLGK